MLVIPANTAYLFAKSLSQMIWGAVLISVVSSVAGYYLAAYYDASVSAAMAMVCGFIFIFVLIFQSLSKHNYGRLES